jgi:hypothetical protein
MAFPFPMKSVLNFGAACTLSADFTAYRSRRAIGAAVISRSSWP